MMFYCLENKKNASDLQESLAVIPNKKLQEWTDRLLNRQKGSDVLISSIWNLWRRLKNMWMLIS